MAMSYTSIMHYDSVNAAAVLLHYIHFSCLTSLSLHKWNTLLLQE